MTEQYVPYIEKKAGDPISAAVWNQMQVMIRQDVNQQIQQAIDSVKTVDQAGDAAKLSGKSLDEISKMIVDRLLAELSKYSGYRTIFKELRLGEECYVHHNLHNMPLADLYQLDYFPVVASEDGHVFETYTTFYLYHSSESRIRYRPENGDFPSHYVEIDPEEGPAYRIPFMEMVNRYDVKYYDDTSMSDLESDFWEKFFSDPNDRVDKSQYCHSPWWDRSCRDERTVKSMQRDWDNLYFQVRPRKSENFPQGNKAVTPAPNNIQLVHYDVDTLGMKMLDKVVLPDVQTNPPADTQLEAVTTDHINIMLLMKV